MPWVPAVAAVAGAAISSDASRSAANTQADSARAAQQTQQDMFNTTNAQQAPWRDAGQTALSDMLYGFGHGSSTTSSSPSPGSQSALGMWMGREAPPPGVSSYMPSGATSTASHPGMTSGQFNHTFDANDLKTNLAPNYQFMLDQGLGAVNNQASVRGGLVGGNALKGINDYAQNYASNGYQQAYDNYNTNQTNIFNRLASIAGLGQTATGQSTQAGLGYAGNIGSAQMAAGAAGAAGRVGSANALAGGLNNAAGWYMSNNGNSGISDSQVESSHNSEMNYLNSQAALGG